MSNLCEFTLRATGKKEQLSKLNEWLNADYRYYFVNGEAKYSGTSKRHFRRIVDFVSKISRKNDEYLLSGKGSCQFDAEKSLINSFMDDYRKVSLDPFDKLVSSHEINLKTASKLLGVDIEMRTEIPFENFDKIFYISNGNSFHKYIEARANKHFPKHQLSEKVAQND